MALEIATYVSELDPLNPEFDDLVREADDHMRMIKETLVNTFPFADGAIPITGNGSALILTGEAQISNGIDLVGGQRFAERVDHLYTPAAGFGEIWLNDSNELIFTDALGVDENLSGHMQASPTPLVNEIGVFVDGNTIRGFAGFEWDGSSFLITDQIITGAASILYGPADTLNWMIGRNSDEGGILLASSNAGNVGGNILMYAENHASTAGDVRLRSGTVNFLEWDQSLTNLILTAAGDIELNALQVDVDGLLQLAASITGRAGINIAVGVAPTTPADGDVWVTAAGEYFARLNGVSVNLDDAGVFTGSIADNQVAVGSGVDALEGTANLTFDGSNLDVTGSVTCDAFTSNGIDDNATVEKLNIADSDMDFGGASGQYTLRRGLTNSNLNITGGSLDSLGANIRLYGESAALFGNDMNLRAGLASFLVWDESAGELELFTGVGTTGGSKTLALTIDSAQAATFAGAVTVEGAFTSLGMDDNATLEVFELANSSLKLGQATGSFVVSSPADVGELWLSGGNDSVSGAVIRMMGGAHASAAGDMEMRADSGIWQKWDESVGNWTLSTSNGAKTLALTIDSSQLATFEGAVTIKGNTIVQGTFTSDGIDDNATVERLAISDSGIVIGANTAASVYDFVRATSSGAMRIAGGNNSADGGQIWLYGSSHATLGGDAQFASSNQTFMYWDESVGSLAISTGVGSKTLAMTVEPDQEIAFANGIKVPDGILMTEQADHRFTPAATLGEMWLRNDANQTLMFTDDAGADHEVAGTDVAGGGGPGGWNYTLQTGTSYTAVVGDFVAASNTGTVTITLPSGHSAGDEIIVKKTGASGTTTVDGNASETIDGATTFDLTTQYASLSIISDGTNWLIV